MGSMKYIITTLVAILATLSTCETFLVGSAPGFTRRDIIVQGWALVETYCPDGTGGCGQRACCPIGSYCDSSEANSNLCCPTRSPCAYDVSVADRCADSTWIEWFTINDPICCLPGQIGVQPGPHDYYGSCATAGSNIPSSMLASTVKLASTAAATSSAPFSPASTSASSAESSKTLAASASASTSSLSSSASLKPTSTSAAASLSVGHTSSSSPSVAASTSTSTANIKASVNRGWSALFAIIGGILGFTFM